MNTLNLVDNLKALKERDENEDIIKAIDFYEYLFKINCDKLYYDSMDDNNYHILDDLYDLYDTEPFYISFYIDDNEIINNDSVDYNILIDDFLKNHNFKDETLYKAHIKFYNEMPYHFIKILILNESLIFKMRPFAFLPNDELKDETALIFFNEDNEKFVNYESYEIIYQCRICKKLNKKGKNSRKKTTKENIIIDIDESDDINNDVNNDVIINDTNNDVIINDTNNDVIINDTNNEVIINKGSNKIICSCGSCILKTSYKKHLLSKKHIIYEKNINSFDTDSETDSENDINENIPNIENLENIQSIDNLENIQSIDNLENIQSIDNLENILHVNNLENIKINESNKNITTKQIYKGIELSKTLKFPVIEINNKISSKALNIEFDKKKYFYHKKKIIDMLNNLYNTNTKFKDLYNNYNLLVVVKDIHHDAYLGEHFNIILINNITNIRTSQLHLYINNSLITTITEIINII
jgi:hypothetical protein